MEGQITDLVAHQKRREEKRKGKIVRGARGSVLALKLSQPEYLTIRHDDFDRLAIDHNYQREEVKSEVATLVAVLRAGGQYAQPITVVRRLFKENGSPAVSRKLWIVDGQQRMWAALEVGTDLQAVCYEVKSIEEERALFIALNTKRTVHANTFMRAHPGASGEFLRTINREGHIAADRLNFAPGGDPTRFSSSTVLCAISKIYGSRAAGSTASMVEALDPKLALDQEKARVFVELLCTALDGNPGYHVTMGFALACSEKWAKGKASLPPARVISALKRTKWSVIAAGTSTDTQILIARRVLKAWQ